MINQLYNVLVYEKDIRFYTNRFNAVFEWM